MTLKIYYSKNLLSKCLVSWNVSHRAVNHLYYTEIRNSFLYSNCSTFITSLLNYFIITYISRTNDNFLHFDMFRFKYEHSSYWFLCQRLGEQMETPDDRNFFQLNKTRHQTPYDRELKYQVSLEANRHLKYVNRDNVQTNHWII